jgi:hypothetical protein
VNVSNVNKCHDSRDLVELARHIQQADQFVRARAHGRLQVIAEQMHFLQVCAEYLFDGHTRFFIQQQAQRVLDEAHMDNELHHAACNMKKVIGTLYHLYQRPSGQKYMSLISAEVRVCVAHSATGVQEWGNMCTHTYLGAYRLEADMSWTPEHRLQQRSKAIHFIDSVLKSSDSRPLFALTNDMQTHSMHKD